MDLVVLSKQCTPLDEYGSSTSTIAASARLLAEPAAPVPDCMINLAGSVPCDTMQQKGDFDSVRAPVSMHSSWDGAS
jgi:hypothetical protein